MVVAALALIAVALLGGAAPADAQTLHATAACRDGLPHGAYELRSSDGRLRVAGAFNRGRRTGSFIFWTSVLTVPYAFVSWIRTRDWRAGLVTVAFAVQYLPWFLAKRTSFLFYMAPVTPFMVLALVYATRDLSEVRVGFERSRTLSPLAALIVLASVGMFAYFWPILVGQTVSWSAWHQRMWLPSWV